MPRTATARTQTADEVVADHCRDDAGELLGISELCKEFAISPRAIRLSEDKGRLSPRPVHGPPVYTRTHREPPPPDRPVRTRPTSHPSGAPYPLPGATGRSCLHGRIRAVAIAMAEAFGVPIPVAMSKALVVG